MLEASNDVTESPLQQLITDPIAIGENIRPREVACPYDDARSDLIIFKYQDSQPIYLTVQLLGRGIATLESCGRCCTASRTAAKSGCCHCFLRPELSSMKVS